MERVAEEQQGNRQNKPYGAVFNFPGVLALPGSLLPVGTPVETLPAPREVLPLLVPQSVRIADMKDLVLLPIKIELDS